MSLLFRLLCATLAIFVFASCSKETPAIPEPVYKYSDSPDEWRANPPTAAPDDVKAAFTAWLNGVAPLVNGSHYTQRKGYSGGHDISQFRFGKILQAWAPSPTGELNGASERWKVKILYATTDHDKVITHELLQRSRHADKGKWWGAWSKWEAGRGYFPEKVVVERRDGKLQVLSDEGPDVAWEAFTPEDLKTTTETGD